jgi:hypothetical protein
VRIERTDPFDPRSWKPNVLGPRMRRTLKGVGGAGDERHGPTKGGATGIERTLGTEGEEAILDMLQPRADVPSPVSAAIPPWRSR